MGSGRRPIIALSVGLFMLVATACSGGGTDHAAPATTATATPASTTIAPSAVPAAASDGCRAAAIVKRGQARIDFATNTGRHWFIRYLPRSYAPTQPMPVVIDLHGYSSGASFQTVASGLGPYGDHHGFITITPEGSGPPRYVTWDTKLRSRDVQYIGELLDAVEHTLCVDTRRVFVTGYSQGAFMASTLACVDADRIAAVATIAGIRDAPGCRPAHAVPVVAFHGTADPDIAYTGGLGPAGLKLPAYDGSGKTMSQEGLQHRPPLNGAAIPVIAGAWAKRNGCDPRPAPHTIAADVTRITWKCPPGAEVELYRVRGGGHTWPGSAFTTAAASILGRTTHSISADAILWRFFQAHPLRES